MGHGSVSRSLRKYTILLIDSSKATATPASQPNAYKRRRTPPTRVAGSSAARNGAPTNAISSYLKFGPFEVSPEDAAEMEFHASQTPRLSPRPAPQTPRKAAKTGNLATPGRAGLPTPVTGGSAGRSLKGSRDIQTPSASPEDSVERRAEMGKTGYAITDDVMEVLKGKVDAQISSKVQAICDRFGMRLSGIEKGRDISRVALKSKDEKIEELRKRVVDLEGEVEKKKALIKAMADSL